MWTGAVPRIRDEEFAAYDRDGREAGWPLRAQDLDRHYSEAERLLEVATGSRTDGISAGSFAARFSGAVRAKWPERSVVPLPISGISESGAWEPWEPWRRMLDKARGTGRLTIRTKAAVRHVVESGVSRIFRNAQAPKRND